MKKRSNERRELVTSGELADRLTAQGFPVTKEGREYKTLCPVHADQKPSLHFSDGRNGFIAVCRSRDCKGIVEAWIRAGVLDDWKQSDRPKLSQAEIDRCHAENERRKKQLQDAENARAERYASHALGIWQQATEDAQGRIAGYLAGRGYNGPLPSHLRFHPSLRCSETTSCFPAIIAKVTNPTSDDFMGIHRTYLAREADDYSNKGKAPVSAAKLSLGKISGGVIQLGHPAKGRLIIAEGIETALSASRVFNAPAWAAISAGNMSRIGPIPGFITDVLIAADRGDAGENAAREIGANFTRSGIAVSVKIPPAPHSDWNDYQVASLTDRRAAA